VTALAPAEVIDRIRLARTESIGPVSFARLLRRFGSAAAAIDALPGLLRAAGRGTPPALPGRAAAEREIAAAQALGGALLVWGEPAYPALLAQLEDAPPVLAVLGRSDVLQRRAVGIVGSRNASSNGQALADTLAEGVARAGVVVVSGMARGIDAAAHEGALRGGATVAAVAGGLDVPYPPEHAGLQRRIAEAGAVVSEAPPGTQPQARHFPRRNRIIAGLSLGVVVVEAALRSGSLITARLALEAGREVFAVPGSPLDPRCRGANALLRDGAHLVETAEDVLDHLGPRSIGPLFPAGVAEPDAAFSPAEPPPDPAAAVARILDLLSASPTSVDDLTRRCQLSAAAVLAVLLDLELEGRVEMLPGNRVTLVAY
jgi:DNA processing protein